MMNDKEIATKLEEIIEATNYMKSKNGYSMDSKMRSDWFDCHDNGYGISITWDPCNNGAQAWFIIQWMESQGKLLWIDYKIIRDDGWKFKDGDLIAKCDRFLWFSGGSDIYFTENLTPRHICLAALEALE